MGTWIFQRSEKIFVNIKIFDNLKNKKIIYYNRITRSVNAE
jgi:hypothetical protein